jgi:glycosyltransferase involved in cell wall biosynthesis
MENLKIKYSILLPARNGGKYLPTCVETIICQDFNDYELIISDDHSDDSSAAYLSTIDHPNVKIVHPPEFLSMAEHWEWVLSQACGEWIIFVGQDDGLQPYFFELAERLTEIANQKKIRTIVSEMSNFFWPGCEAFYGNTAVRYWAVSELKVCNCKIQALLALFGFQTYFELPIMYTSSLFHRDIIIEAKEKQNGKLFVTHPQDANLGAIACSLDNTYLKSGIPLGWAGASPKSAGMAIESVSADKKSDTETIGIFSLKEDYLKKIANSKLPFHPLSGDFSLGSGAIYFWGALLQTQHLRKAWINKLLLSKKFKTLMFAGVLAEISSLKVERKNNKIRMFEEIINLNQCNPILIVIISKLFRIFYKFNMLNVLVNKRFKRLFKPSYYYKENWKNNPNINMINASKRIERMITKKRMIARL